MIVTLQFERIRTIGQVAAFVEASEPVDFQPADRKGAYELVARILSRLGYYALDRPSKTRVKRFLSKTTGYSRAQITRLIRQHGKTGRVADRRDGNQGRPFERVYTPVDARLLARVGADLGQMSGLATRVVLHREFHVFGDARFERLAGISASHIYNLRGSRTYRARDVCAPYEKLRSLPGAGSHVKPGVTFAGLDAEAHAISDLRAARALNAARNRLFQTIGRDRTAA